MKLQYLNLFTIPLKFILIFYVSKHAFNILTDEDKFYQNRGYNNTCQNNENKLDKKICEQDKHSKFIFLYIDSLPYDLFKYKNSFIDNNSNTYKIRHYGISDSGPAFSSFVTGKIANKYEGKIGKIDNIFRQFKIADYKVRGFGYNYPIEEMIGREFFSEYKNVKEGLNEAFCEDFIRLHDVNIEKFKYIKESLIFSQKLFFEKFDKYYKEFTNLLEKKKEKIFECLKQKINNENISYFVYNVYSDVIGHQFSRKSEFYIKKISALKANTDILIEYLEKYQKETLLIILSDHGIVSSVWESELTNHGNPIKGNESFIFLKSNKVKNNTNLDSYMNSYDVCCYLADLIENINYPINSNGFSQPRKNDVFSKLVMLRSKEKQLLKYFDTFEKDFLEKLNIDLKAELDQSPFIRISKNFEDGGDFESNNQNPEILFEEYFKYLKNLENVKNQILNHKNEDKGFYNFILGLVIFTFLIFKNLIEIIISLKSENRTYGFIIASIFIALPIYFLIIQKIYPSYFLPYIFATHLLFLYYIHKNKNIFSESFTNKILLILGLNLALIMYNYFVSFHNFYFFYYQNQILQSFIIIIGTFYSFYLLRKLLKNNLMFFNYYLKNLFIIFYLLVDLIMIYYEIKLIFSFDYHQTRLMMILSRSFYCLAILTILLSFNFVTKYRFAILAMVLKLVFWLGNNFTRVAFYLFILPVFFYYLKISKKDQKQLSSTNLQKLFDFVILIYQGINIFLLLRGELDTNISVRAAQKNWEMTLEEFPAFTGAIFSINKFLVFIFIYFFIFLIIKNKKDIKRENFFDLLSFSFDSLILKATDIWFGFIMFIYLLNIDDAFNQRTCFMFNTANIILVISSYIITIAEFLIFYTLKNDGYSNVLKKNQNIRLELN